MIVSKQLTLPLLIIGAVALSGCGPKAIAVRPTTLVCPPAAKPPAALMVPITIPDGLLPPE